MTESTKPTKIDSAEAQEIASKLTDALSAAIEKIDPQVLAILLKTQTNIRSTLAYMKRVDAGIIAQRLEVDNMQPLIYNSKEDHEIKVVIIEHLTGNIASSVSLLRAMQWIVDKCFNMDIPEERLVSFFENQRIIDFMLETVIEGLGQDTQKTIVTEIPAEMEEDFMQRFNEFKEVYDPTSTDHTMSSFMGKLINNQQGHEIYGERYNQYAQSWIVMNTELFSGLLRTSDGGLSHIEEMIKACYIERGKDTPEQFIRQNIQKFLKEKDGVFVLNIDRLQKFYFETLPVIASDKYEHSELGELIADSCLKRVEENEKSEDASILIDQKNAAQSLITFDKLRENILDKTVNIDDFSGILTNPTLLPKIMKEHYSDWCPEDGDGMGEYYKYLRVRYGTSIDDQVQFIGNMNKACKGINSILQTYARTAGMSDDQIKVFMVSDKVTQTNDLRELVRIANETEDEAERFAARRKFELAERLFFSNVARHVFSMDDAILLQEKLVSLTGLGFSVAESPEIYDVYVKGGHNGKIQLCNEDGDFIDKEGQDDDEKIKSEAEMMKSFKISNQLQADLKPEMMEFLREMMKKVKGGAEYEEEQVEMTRLPIKVIPAKFCGVDGYLYAIKVNKDDGSVRWVGTKSKESILLKLLRKPDSIEEMRDIIRITFLAKNEEDLPKIRENMRKYYWGLGSGIKLKGGYAHVNMLPQNYQRNSATAAGYEDQALQHVGKHFVTNVDGRSYHVSAEMRFGPMKLIKEKMAGHPISHATMKEKTTADVIKKKLAPPEINFFRENLYDEDGNFKKSPKIS